MKENNKNDRLAIKFDREDMIDSIVEKTHLSTVLVKTVYQALENQVFENISLADNNTDISIKLFEGFEITGNFEEGKKYNSNLKSIGDINVSPRIKPKANFLRSYKERLFRQ